MAKPVFIVSTGRTGTNFLADLFNKLHASFCDAYHERGISRAFQIATHLWLEGRLPLSFIEKLWTITKHREIESCEKQLHVDSNCFLYGMGALLLDNYPQGYLIHIVRHPSNYITSHLQFQDTRLRSYLANKWVPFWQPNPEKVSFENPLIPIQSIEAKLAWLWHFKNQAIYNHRFSKQYLRLRYEDLFSSDLDRSYSTYTRLCSFLECEPSPLERFNNYRTTKLNASNPKTFDIGYSARLQCAVTDYCHQLMPAFGYDLSEAS